MKRIRGILIFIFIILLGLILCNYQEFFKAGNEYKNVNDVIVINDKEEIKINKINLLKEYYNNDDIIGIISIEGIKDFNYPIVQTTNNDYYLNHNYYKNYDSYGSIYADYRINIEEDKKILIYSHSSIKKDIPFNKLELYYDEEYYNNHKYITLETKTNKIRYEIFSVFVETNDFTYMNINFNNSKDWYSHILKLQKKSLYKTNVKLKSDDDILIIQTCSNNKNYKNYKNKYLLVISRRVENE